MNQVVIQTTKKVQIRILILHNQIQNRILLSLILEVLIQFRKEKKEKRKKEKLI